VAIQSWENRSVSSRLTIGVLSDNVW
jgi:hypothetical protein